MITPRILRPSRVVFAAAIILLLSACAGEPSDDGDDGVRPGTPIAAMQLQPRDLSRRLSLSGTVEPRIVVQLAARTAGAVETVGVEEGDRVGRGERIAQLDMSEQQAELSRARAEVEAAELAYRRTERLRDRGMVSNAQYDEARVARDVARSERELWQTRVAFGRIISPIDGVVTARHVDPGEAVQAHETLFELAALDELVVRFGVSELDLVHLSPKMPVPVHFDARPGLAVEGRIRRIFPLATAGTRLTTVEVALPSDVEAGGVRPGFLARTRMDIDRRESVLVVPAAAVGLEDEQSYVYVIEDDELVRRKVAIGVTRGRWAEVRSGLKAGETVLASNPIDMNEGQSVRVVQTVEFER